MFRLQCGGRPMRKINLITCGIALLFSSCGITLNKLPPILDSEYACGNWVVSNINYALDAGDTWNRPETTLNNGYGDCEDHALLFLWLCAYNGFGKGTLNIGYVTDANGKMRGGHVGAICNGVEYGGYEYFHIIMTMDFDTAMTMTVVH